jgi:hypothetical protein
LNKYFRYENREFIEYEHVPCGYINPTKECLVLSIMEDTSRPKIERIGLFIKKQNIQNVYLDFISTESYIDVNTYKRLEAELSGFNFKILTVNILNCQFESHIFFPLHALQLLHSFGDKIETINYIQDTNLSSKKRLKKYLFLNHHLRTERFKIFESLYNNNKLNDGLVSFCWNMEHEEFNPQWYDVNKNDIEYIKNSNAYNILPLELDGMNKNKSKYFEVKNEIQNPRYFSPPNTNISHYFNIYFEIVTEGFSSRTPFHPYADRSNILHYSEKIYKPILFGVPFCFWGPENTLEYFSKEFGMTFNCPLYYCNVGYDLNEFCDKVNELSNLSYLELHKLYYEYFDEIRNNQQILIRYLKNIQL